VYQFSEDFSRTVHFWFDKKLIKNKNWALLPSASKSILPIILGHQDDKGMSFPSEQTISILSGMSDKTVRQGINGLDGFSGLEISYYTTRRGRRSRKFHVLKPPKKPGRAFPFYKSVFEGGNWLHLLPSAHALYPVMRYFGFFDSDILEIFTEFEPSDFDEAFESRNFDFCEAERDLLAEFAGISKRALYRALASLEECNLIERHPEDLNGWKVFLHPPKYYLRGYLNEKTAKKYRHLLR
jgi:DNA-binding transcriptional ArsR family regulator